MRVRSFVVAALGLSLNLAHGAERMTANRSI
jgi:hypothetical protein